MESRVNVGCFDCGGLTLEVIWGRVQRASPQGWMVLQQRIYRGKLD